MKTRTMGKKFEHAFVTYEVSPGTCASSYSASCEIKQGYFCEKIIKHRIGNEVYGKAKLKIMYFQTKKLFE